MCMCAPFDFSKGKIANYDDDDDKKKKNEGIFAIHGILHARQDNMKITTKKTCEKSKDLLVSGMRILIFTNRAVSELNTEYVYRTKV